jgi:HD-like signal output (HDOD) protein
VYSTVDIQIRRERRVSELISLLPPISDTVSKLLVSLTREDFSLQEISALIEKDAALAAHVLRVANSALYARRGEVCSVTHAISVLGAERLRNSALTLSVNRLINQARLPTTLSAASFNIHCLATATMSDLLAQRVRTPYPEGAFAAGLLHGIGKLLIALVLQKEYDSFERTVKSTGRSWEDVEQEWMGFTHSEIAGIALQKWKIPPEIRKAIVDQDAGIPGSENWLSLSSVLACAHECVAVLGYEINCCTNFAHDPKEPELVIASLGCGNASKVVQDFKSSFEHTRALCA